MGAIINFSLNLDKLDKSKVIKGKNGNYYNLTLSVNDEISQFGDNSSIYTSQTKEEREAKTPRSYVGNGKVVWTDGSISAVPMEKSQAAPQAQEEVSDLPF
jgi:hypothetical protein